MQSLRRKVQEVIQSEKSGRVKGLEWLLSPPAVLYGIALKVRERYLVPRELSCKVISVGNLTTGGTGKTPTTLSMARIIRQMGYRVVIISRGYRGAQETVGGVVSDGKTVLMGVKEAGDEPFMMARQLKGVPVVIGKNRFAAGMRSIQQFEPDVIIMDDAFQHRQLARDIDIVLLDARRPFGNGHLLPRGPLREPLAALARGDAFVMMQSGAAPPEPSAEHMAEIKKWAGDKPVFQAFRTPRVRDVITHRPKEPHPSGRTVQPFRLRDLKGNKVYAFCGLASNVGFRRTLEECGCDIIGFAEFADHHWYSRYEINAVFDAAHAVHAELVVTTDKDYVRMSSWNKGPVDLVVMGIDVHFEPAAAFSEFIFKRLGDLIPRQTEAGSRRPGRGG